MAQDVIAIICDCDGTLCPDTSKKLVRDMGIDSCDFWKRQVANLVKDGWDPPLAYLNQLLKVSQGPEVENLTKAKLCAVGASIDFYSGALDFVPRLRDALAQKSEYEEAQITVEWYIVSSGIEALLRATQLKESATDIFGCEFAYDDFGQAFAVKRAVTFTEKTKFIYAINKGISGTELRRDPYRVNASVEEEDRRIPFRNMVYVGDGPSDIPCFSMIRRFGGQAIGVIPPDDLDLRNPYQMTQGNRITAGPYTADYTNNTDLFKMMNKIISGIADSILEKRAQRIKSSPSH